MSYVNLPPSATFPRLERVLKNQKRLLVYDVAAASLLFGGILASLGTLL
jgi:hypothetical protein